MRLKRSMKKYGNFSFIIFSYYDLTQNSFDDFIKLETFYIQSFDPKYIFNFKLDANSMLGFKHSKISREKTKQRMNSNHPMKGKFHSEESKMKISLSKIGLKNPMYGKSHSEESRMKISLAVSLGKVEIYDLSNKLINTFDNATLASKYLNIHKSTVNRYIKSGKIYKNQYKFIRLG